MHENIFVLMICTGLSSAAWHLLTGPNSIRSKKYRSGGTVHSTFYGCLFYHLFKPLLDVCVCLQFELSAGVGPVHEEKPLLGVHLFHQDGCFLIVPHLKKNSFKYFYLCQKVYFKLRLSLPCSTGAACISDILELKFRLVSEMKSFFCIPEHRSHHLDHFDLPKCALPPPRTFLSPHSPSQKKIK